MLKPKKNIGVVYGHDSNLLNIAKQKINQLSDEGYRVKPVILNDETLRRENDMIFNAFKEKFENIDAAIIFMTPDDLAISVRECNNLLKKNQELTAEEFKNRLSLRSRQNVIYELGYVAAVVGENNYRIFCPDGIEIPSDILGKYTERNLENVNVENIIEDFIVHNLSCSKVSSYLSYQDYITDYSHLCKNQNMALNEFDQEYNELDSTDDKLVYLFERIVFDSYFQNPNWWLSKINGISVSNDLQKLTLSILRGVSDYMSAWKPSPDKKENIQDINRIFHSKEILARSLEEISLTEVNPVVLMVGFDYLGLAYNKLGREKSFDVADRITHLENSIAALKTVAKFAENHDDKQLPLWKGFSLFNLARSIHDKSVLEKDTHSYEWRETFFTAIETRDVWRRCHYVLPIEVREGIETEYQHAIADRILRIEFDENGNSKEKMPYRFTKDDVVRYKELYEEWWKNPKQIRVRLASNVHASWDSINKLHSFIR